MDKISAILNIVGLALLLMVFFVKMSFAMALTTLIIAGILIITAAVRTIYNIFKGRRF